MIYTVAVPSPSAIAFNDEDAHVKVSTEGPEFYLVFVRGKYDNRGNTAVVLSPKDLLVLN